MNHLWGRKALKTNHNKCTHTHTHAHTADRLLLVKNQDLQTVLKMSYLT